MKRYPVNVIWRNKDTDMKITIVGFYGIMNEIRYYQSSSGTGIPDHEIVWPKETFFEALKTFFRL
jgi:hypothetical protein